MMMVWAMDNVGIEESDVGRRVEKKDSGEENTEKFTGDGRLPPCD